MRCYGLTDIGKIRKINEDSFLVKTTPEGVIVAVVADGMGGHKAGEEASYCAVTEMVKLTTEASKFFKDYSDDQICSFLKNSVNKINKKIYNMSVEAKNKSGMGTTIVACIVYNSRCYIANVGDSRLYRWTKNALEQITTDHSYVSELVKMGVITKEQAKIHPNKNVITKAVGTEKNVIPDIFIKNVLPGEILVICTDGLTNMVADDEIHDVMLKNDSIEKSVSTLVEIANKNGGSDNITVVLLEVESEGGDSL